MRGKGIDDAVVRDDVYSFLKALVDYGAGKGKFTNEMRRALKSVYKRDFGGFLSDNDYQIGVILGPRTITKTYYDAIVEVLMRYGTQKGVVWQAGEMNLMKNNIANVQLFSSAVFSGRAPLSALTMPLVDHMVRMNYLKTILYGNKNTVHMVYDNFSIQFFANTAARLGDVAIAKGWEKMGSDTAWRESFCSKFSDISVGLKHVGNSDNVTVDDLMCTIVLRFAKDYKLREGLDPIREVFTVNGQEHMCFIRSLIDYSIAVGQLDVDSNMCLDDIAKLFSRTDCPWKRPDEPIFGKKTANGIDVTVPATEEELLSYIKELGALANICGMLHASSFRNGAETIVKTIPRTAFEEYSSTDGINPTDHLLWRDLEALDIRYSSALPFHYLQLMLNHAKYRHGHMLVGRDKPLQEYFKEQTGLGVLSHDKLTQDTVTKYEQEFGGDKLSTATDFKIRVPKPRNLDEIAAFVQENNLTVDGSYSKRYSGSPFSENELAVLTYLRDKTPEKFDEKDNCLSEMVLSFADHQHLHDILMFCLRGQAKSAK